MASGTINPFLGNSNNDNYQYIGSGNWQANGFAGNDILKGGAGNDYIDGGEGDDEIDGGAGNDYLISGNGNDLIYGGSGNDVLDCASGGSGGRKTLYGGTGNDSYYVSEQQNIIEDPNQGVDTVVYFVGSTSPINSYTLPDNVENLILLAHNIKYGYGNELNNSITTSDGLDVSNVSHYLSGYGGNDTLEGGTAADTLIGGIGNDSLSGGDGNDSLSGDSGNDTLVGGLGNDALIGGLGNDTYYVDSTSDVVTENLNEGTDTVYTSILNGYTLGTNLENLTLLEGARSGYGNSLNNIINGNADRNYLDGGTGNDTINGAGGNDQIVGGYGDDSLLGGEGDDHLVGYQDNDYLSGGNGNDTLEGYGGTNNERDTLSGGAGADIFRLGYDPSGSVIFYRGNGNSYATIEGFSQLEGDKIDILGSSSNFSEYKFTQTEADTQISYKADGDLIAVVKNTTASSFSQLDLI